MIALLYLVPISWSTARWGQGPGTAAAVFAALAFNFFFIPPYYTLYIGSLELAAAVGDIPGCSHRGCRSDSIRIRPGAGARARSHFYV